MIGWTTLLFLPTVIVTTFCWILNATCLLAFPFVAKIADRSPHITSQGGTVMSKRNLMTICFKKTMATQIWRLKNGIGLEMKVGEHDVGCAIVAAGRRTVQAQISEVTTIKTVTVRPRENTMSNNLAVPFCSKRLAVRSSSPLNSKLNPEQLIMRNRTKIKRV